MKKSAVVILLALAAALSVGLISANTEPAPPAAIEARYETKAERTALIQANESLGYMMISDETNVYSDGGPPHRMIWDTAPPTGDARTPEQITKDAARTRLEGAIDTLRTWASEYAIAYADWPTLTAAQKDARQREAIRRQGLFFDNFADLLETEGLGK